MRTASTKPRIRSKPRKRDRDDVWPDVAARRGGEVVRGKRRRVDKVRVGHESWTIVLDHWVTSNGQTSQSNTRVRALFEPTTPFRFKIYRENFLTGLAKRFGLHDTITGDLLLDRDFVVRTDNESMIRSLAMRVGLGQVLLSLPKGRFEITKFRGKRRPRPEKAAELRWVSGGVITDRDELDGLFRLFEDALTGLHKIGAARAVAVDYEL